MVVIKLIRPIRRKVIFRYCLLSKSTPRYGMELPSELVTCFFAIVSSRSVELDKILVEWFAVERRKNEITSRTESSSYGCFLRLPWLRAFWRMLRTEGV